MSRRRTDKVTVWISLKRIKQTLIGAALLALLIIVVTYEIPLPKRPIPGACRLPAKSLPLMQAMAGQTGSGKPPRRHREGCKPGHHLVSTRLLAAGRRAGHYDKRRRLRPGGGKHQGIFQAENGRPQTARADDRGQQGRPVYQHASEQHSVQSVERRADLFPPNNEDSKKLAELIQAEIRHNLENTQRLAKTDDKIYLLQALRMPSALVEVGFLSHPQESELLRDEKYQRKVAASVYNGILRYASGESSSESSQAAE